MKTLRSLSNRKLDKIQDRTSEKYWKEIDVAPWPQNKRKIRVIKLLLTAIAKERLRRIGL